MSQLTESLNALHQKSDFSCGNEMLDTYLHKQASQDVKRKLAVCFVINEKDTNQIKGYYTLSNNSIPLSHIPNNLQGKLPRSYESIPTILMGRLAVDNRFKGQGIGKLILVDALKRSWEIAKTIGSYALVVDPINQDAENFYLKYGFIKLPDSGKMFISMKTIDQLFK
jgi:predicted GNAT family N-acyltransferase